MEEIENGRSTTEQKDGGQERTHGEQRSTRVGGEWDLRITNWWFIDE